MIVENIVDEVHSSSFEDSHGALVQFMQPDSLGDVETVTKNEDTPTYDDIGLLL